MNTRPFSFFSKKLSRPVCFLIGILALGLALRVTGLQKKVGWSDEGFTVAHAAKSVRTICFAPLPENGDIFKNIHPPFEYLLVHFLLPYGEDPGLLRFPSVVFGVLGLFMTYLAAARFSNRRTALLTAFLLAISPFHITFS